MEPKESMASIAVAEIIQLPEFTAMPIYNKQDCVGSIAEILCRIYGGDIMAVHVEIENITDEISPEIKNSFTVSYSGNA